METAEKRRKRAHDYYMKNREKVLATVRAWFAAHPEYKKLWNKANAKKITAYKRRYRATHREQVSAYQKQWRAAHPNYNREWLAANRRRMKGDTADGEK